MLRRIRIGKLRVREELRSGVLDALQHVRVVATVGKEVTGGLVKREGLVVAIAKVHLVDAGGIVARQIVREKPGPGALCTSPLIGVLAHHPLV